MENDGNDGFKWETYQKIIIKTIKLNDIYIYKSRILFMKKKKTVCSWIFSCLFLKFNKIQKYEYGLFVCFLICLEFYSGAFWKINLFVVWCICNVYEWKTRAWYAGRHKIHILSVRFFSFFQFFCFHVSHNHKNAI